MIGEVPTVITRRQGRSLCRSRRLPFAARAAGAGKRESRAGKAAAVALAEKCHSDSAGRNLTIKVYIHQPRAGRR